MGSPDHFKIKMQIVILCGGLGTRLTSVIGDTPKSLAPISDRTFIDYQLDFLNQFNDVSEVLLLTGYGSDVLEKYVKDNRYNFKLLFSKDSEERLGTFRALREASYNQLLKNDFLLLFGDSIPNCDLPKIYTEFQKFEYQLGLTYISAKIVDELANIELKTDRVLYCSTAATDNLEFVDYGVTYIKSDIFNHPISQQFSDLKKFIEFYTENNYCIGFELFEPFLEIGTKESYEKAVVEFTHG